MDFRNLDSEQRKAVVEAARTVILRIRAAVRDKASWHIGSRDLQRHFQYIPKCILERFGIESPEVVEDVDPSIYQNPELFYQFIARYNNWND